MRYPLLILLFAFFSLCRTLCGHELLKIMTINGEWRTYSTDETAYGTNTRPTHKLFVSKGERVVDGPVIRLTRWHPGRLVPCMMCFDRWN